MKRLTFFNYSQIHSTAPRMARFLSNITSRNNILLCDIRVKNRFSWRVHWIIAPSHEIVDCLLRSVSIVNYQRITVLFKSFLNLRQLYTCLFGNNNSFRKISIDNLPNKIHILSIPRRDDDSWIDILKIVEPIWKLRGHCTSQHHWKYQLNNH